MKQMVKNIKNASKWVIFRETFFILLFLVSVVGLYATANRVPAVDAMEQATMKQLEMKGNVGGDRQVERGPRLSSEDDAQGISAVQNGSSGIQVTFTQDFGFLTYTIYDRFDNPLSKGAINTATQKSLLVNVSALPSGIYYLQFTNSKGGTVVAQFTIL